jgi:hypothetical protein
MGIVLIVIGPIITSNGYSDQQNAVGATSGQLTFPKIDTSKPVFVELGGAGNNYSFQELQNGIDLTKLICFQNEDNRTVQFPITVTFGDDGQVLVSARILDSKNNTIARIIDNEWKTSSDNMEVWDRNYNSYAFEVRDSNGIPVLQVVIGTQNEIMLGVSLYNQGIPLFSYVTTGINYFSDFPTAEELKAVRNATIFQYPSSSHLGQMRDIAIPDFNSPHQMTNAHLSEENPLLISSLEIWGGVVITVIGLIITTFVGV